MNPDLISLDFIRSKEVLFIENDHVFEDYDIRNIERAIGSMKDYNFKIQFDAYFNKEETFDIAVKHDYIMLNSQFVYYSARMFYEFTKLALEKNLRDKMIFSIGVSEHSLKFLNQEKITLAKLEQQDISFYLPTKAGFYKALKLEEIWK